MNIQPFFRLLLWAILIGGGFILGTAWNNGFQPHAVAEEPVALTSPKTELTKVPPPGLTESEKATIRLFENTAPSVAFITTSQLRQDFWTSNIMEIPRGSGSGFVWDNKGHIITNYHVIQNADKAQVTLADRSTWDAELVGAAPEKDLAVLRIDAPSKVLKPIIIGQSENLLVGQSVLAIGNPYGLDQTLTTGIISALGREISSANGIPIRGVIQTDAAINPGNSGGPLLNSSGELIGVNTAIYSPSGASAGIGFSIPVDVVKWVVPELMRHGRIMRPTLGVEFASQQITRRLGLEGALITHVESGSSADRAGLKPTYRDRYGRIRLGDAILSINGENIKSANEIILVLEKYKPGDIVKVKVKRDDREMILDMKLDPAQ